MEIYFKYTDKEVKYSDSCEITKPTTNVHINKQQPLLLPACRIINDYLSIDQIVN